MKQQWEYKTWSYSSWQGGNPEDIINQLGAEGWEMVLGFQQNDSMVIFFKRPKP